MASRTHQLTVGRPPRGTFGTIVETLESVWGRRELIMRLTLTAIRRRGADSVLGHVWWILDPALQMLVYTVLVTFIRQRSQPDFPLFIFVALLPWKWFSSALGTASESIRKHDKVLRQIAFPQITLPIANVVESVFEFCVGLIPLFVLYIFYPGHLTAWVFALPLIIIVQLLVTIPFAIILSAINVFYRDIGNSLTHVLRLWFYLSPSLYSIETMRNMVKNHPPLDFVVSLNPFTWIFTGYRDVLFEGRAPDLVPLLALSVISILFTFVSIHIFRRMALSFVKVL
jgi:ABC-type polysaccharide/polyol phosphate export permease